jgi:5-methylcytosine-specific restriction endonuclease McrA
MTLVEMSDAGLPITIFRTEKAAIAAILNGCRVREMARSIAVGLIRAQVILRADELCERCGTVLTEDTGEMHETLPKGKGGEVSLANCEWLCHRCHQGDKDSAHGNRRTRFGEVAA